MAVLDTLAKNRLVTGFLMGALVFSCILLGGKFLLALLLVFIILASKEYADILRNKGFLPFFKVILIVSVTMVLLSASGYDNLIPLALVVGTIGSFLAVLFRGRQPYIANVATTILGFLIAWMPCHVCLIRNMGAEVSLLGFTFKQGLYFLVFIFFVILLTDIGAYYFGVRYGKHKLSPVISPKKSVEGAVAGGLCAIIVGLIIGKLIGISLYHSFVLALITTVMAQLGDLSESLIKRDAGVKDSGNSLPGHGGFLDRADSYLFSVPVAYFYIKYFILTGLSFPMIMELVKKVINVICS
ncbi:MAG: phosphatidate cytidylyltransferase [Candidatus Gastranaerophilales bacterium]|nr:phosphatidate cytidylyltransferase [Candidatus Gastranaerophilales bacterium]